VGLGISRTNVDSEWHPVYNILSNLFFEETIQLVGSNPNVICIREMARDQTWEASPVAPHEEMPT